ncbi:AMP-binding protein [Cupriavidus taiwanensis]|uniref:2,3-dihydroxybenzoate-AMP ligase, Enterobactin synthetase component E, AMP-dependent synthetase and ligase n=2 Tax=Cupriavidus taiwanensis TaxID=164546 RepID=B2AHR4_CUPTR|nr:AMP-binding protein [Cupriavidus taiwanensis]CAP63313.1 2,3-dihydroxybenzoate-AMP ligase, Enterobactin synthetase component E, AMP-dependent synthetase and ligase [Cupriavidus taiwanensis LMG 19424]SOZ09378.1 2,3-dihydroxybenzoate-AMP ligase, Enterobactin synthetase component E, AMP-dependent synthetase and ligase [Cupriavidus taiwanensis]SOZ11504.1 2,3-dihydroxybenzoate-AMP ligase, Enterobactin synthetase component E, AMP-dependent synthetase and ligase [Cupriavidus taiwanensis]SOZ42858.1 2
MLQNHTVRPPQLLAGVRYPDEDRLRRYVAEGVLTGESLAGAFRESFERHADRLALAGPEGELTYRQLDEQTDRLAAALLALGLKPLDRAVFQCGNCNELLLAFFACLKAGIIPLCSLQAFRKLEISYLGNLCEARLHLVQGDDPKFDDVAFAEEMQAEVPSFAHVLQARGERRGKAVLLADLIEQMPLVRARELLAGVRHDPFQVAVFQLSGGTTGVPKIIPRFQNEYLYNMRAVAACNGYTQEDVLFFPTPYMHNLNMGCFFGPFLLTGATVTVTPDIGEENLQRLVRDYRPTWFGVAGPILTRIAPELAKAGAAERARRNFVAPKNAAGLTRLTGSPTHHIFGMTEGVIMFARRDDPQEIRDSSVGSPVSEYDEVKIVHPGTEDPVPDGEAGEALFRGPYTIRGYYKSEKEDVTRFTADGFYRSGDLMSSRVVDGRRYYFFCGRIKDVVDRGGEKINAEELENVINLHPAVLACAVVGMPDRIYGERVCAFIVPKPPATSLSLPQLTEYLQQAGLAKFKWPERVEVVREFPLTASGKLSKALLRQQITQTLEAEAARGNTNEGK